MYKIVKLVSTAGTGYYYTTTRPEKGKKLELKKYDPVKRAYVKFKEVTKLK